MTIFAVRPKWTYSDPERYGYPPDYAPAAASGALYRVCPSCKASAPDGEPIEHRSGCDARR